MYFRGKSMIGLCCSAIWFRQNENPARGRVRGRGLGNPRVRAVGRSRAPLPQTHMRAKSSSRNVRHEQPIGCLSPWRQLVCKLRPLKVDERDIQSSEETHFTNKDVAQVPAAWLFT